MSSKRLNQTALSSPDVASLAGSIASEDRLDSDLEADLQQAGLLANVHAFDVEHFSVNSSEVLSVSNAPSTTIESRSRLSICEAGVRPSAFVRKAVLSGVSNQLKSASSKVDVGTPSCLSFRKYLVVGTTKGFIFGFNFQQVLRFCLGASNATSNSDAQVSMGQGPVTALSQNMDGTQLLSGYQSGRIAVWRLSTRALSPESHDVHLLQGKLVSHESNDNSDPDSLSTDVDPESGSLLSSSNHARSAPQPSSPSSTPGHVPLPRRLSGAKLRLGGKSASDTSIGQLLHVIDDAHGVGQAIALINFTTVPTLAVVVDTGGSVFALNFKRGLTGSRNDSVCFFSGSRGEICALDALGSTTLTSNTSEPAVPSTADRIGPEIVTRVSKSILGYALVAMASFTKLIVAQLRPRLQIAHWQPLKGPVACLPLLAWMWTQRTESGKVDNALLAFGRGCTFHVLYVAHASPGPATLDPVMNGATGHEDGKNLVLQFRPLYSFELGYELISLNWISSSQVVVLDTAETAHLLDSSTGEDTETADLSGVQLCYSSYLFQSTANGGSVSEAMAYAGQRACSQSVASHGSQLLILGRTGVHLLALRTWSNIVRSLFVHRMFDTALIYCNRALDSAYTKQQAPHSDNLPPAVSAASHLKVPSIPSTNLSFSKLQSEIVRILRDLCCPHLVSHITNANGNQTNLGEPGRSIGPVTIALLVRVACYLEKGCELLVTDLYEHLGRDPQSRSWLFLALYEIIIRQLPHFGQLSNDRLGISVASGTVGSITAIAYSLRPNLVMDWVNWCLTSDYDVDRMAWCRAAGCTQSSDDGRLWAEQSLLSLPPHCIDLNEAVRLCWRHQLFKAYLHIYTDILFDFETPFRHLVEHMMQSDGKVTLLNHPASDLSSDLVPYGQTLLLLLRNALAGESYSQQPLPSPMDVDVPSHIFNLLLNEAISEKSYAVAHQYRSKYPRLWLVLSHCATDFLNLLILSIGGDRFFSDSDVGLSHRKHLYHKLIGCALEEHWTVAAGSAEPKSRAGDHTDRFAIPVFLFLVQQLAQTGNESIRLEDKLFKLYEHICSELMHSQAPIPTDLFEAGVIELIEAGRFTQLDTYLTLAERANLYSISEYIHRRENRRVDALEAQLARLSLAVNSRRTPESTVEQLAVMVFAFLDQVFPQPRTSHTDSRCDFSPAEIERIQSVVLSQVQLLATWDSERTLRLLYHMFLLPLPGLLTKVFPKFPWNATPGEAVAGTPVEPEPACVLLLGAYYRARKLYLDGQYAHVEPGAHQSETQTYRTKTDATGWNAFLTVSYPEVAESYIQLLARTGQTDRTLLQFLKTNSDCRVNAILQFLSPTDFPRACAYLYEKQGQFDLASNIYEQLFLTQWHRLIALVSDQPDNEAALSTTAMKSDTLESTRSATRKAADSWFAFAQRRCAPAMGDVAPAEDCERIWFHVVDVLLHEEQGSKYRLLQSDINDLFHSLLSYLPQSISLTSIVSYILQSATKETTSRFNPQTSNLLTRLVATCHMEVEQMSLNCELAKRELTQKQSVLLRRLQQGFTASRNGFWCSLCQASLRRPGRIDCNQRVAQHASCSKANLKSIVAFHCGHMFHARCLSITGAVETNSDRAVNLLGFRRHWICPVCNPCPIQPDTSCNSDLQNRRHSAREEPYLSWYDPIQLDVRQTSTNPFD